MRLRPASSAISASSPKASPAEKRWCAGARAWVSCAAWSANVSLGRHCRVAERDRSSRGASAFQRGSDGAVEAEQQDPLPLAEAELAVARTGSARCAGRAACRAAARARARSCGTSRVEQLLEVGEEAGLALLHAHERDVVERRDVGDPAARGRSAASSRCDLVRDVEHRQRRQRRRRSSTGPRREVMPASCTSRGSRKLHVLAGHLDLAELVVAERRRAAQDERDELLGRRGAGGQADRLVPGEQLGVEPALAVDQRRRRRRGARRPRRGAARSSSSPSRSRGSASRPARRAP